MGPKKPSKKESMEESKHERNNVRYEDIKQKAGM